MTARSRTTLLCDEVLKLEARGECPASLGNVFGELRFKSESLLARLTRAPLGITTITFPAVFPALTYGNHHEIR